MSSVHLICGPTGAGKSTFAVRLADDIAASRYAIDEWMSALFWMDAPDEPSFTWAIERVGRCEALIWAHALRDLASGRDVVLDLGFSTRGQRDGFKARAADAGAEAVLWVLDAAVEDRRARVRARNETLANPHDLPVDDETFDWMEGYFEPPSPDENGRAPQT